MDIKVTLTIGFPGATREDIITIEDDDLKDLADEQRTKAINEAVEEWAWNYIELDWEKVDEEKVK